MNFLDLVIENWESILNVFDQCIKIGSYIIAGASILVNLTPSNKDNLVLEKINSVLNLIALNFKRETK